MNGCTRAVVLVLDFAIPGGIIGVLRLFVLLVRVSVGNATENLELREEEKVICGRRHRACGAAVACVVCVLGNGLEDGTEFCWDNSKNLAGIAREARPANVCTHLRSFPSAGVRSATVHREIAARRDGRVIGSVA